MSKVGENFINPNDTAEQKSDLIRHITFLLNLAFNGDLVGLSDALPYARLEKPESGPPYFVSKAYAFDNSPNN